MLPRKRRLSRREFPGGSVPGKRLASAHFSLWTGPSEKGGAAAVVSKKVAAKSVDRHLLKRRMYDVLKTQLPHNRFVVLYARSGSNKLSFAALKAELQALLGKIR